MTKGERSALADVPTALYRFYDNEDRLLYVGITYDLQVRWRSHKRNQLWWLDVVRKEYVWLPNRAEAEKAENRAILIEKPIWDKSRAPRKELKNVTACDNPRKNPYEERQVSNAARVISEALDTGLIPAWSFLPLTSTLAGQLGLAEMAVELGRRRLSLGDDARLTQSQYHYITAPRRSFPAEQARQHGEMYVVARHHFGHSAFTAQELADQSRISCVWRFLAKMEKRGLVTRESGRPAIFQLTTTPEEGI